MMHKHLLAAALGSLAAAATAQTLSPAPTPGLWESEVRTLMNGQDIGAMMRKAREDMLASMPPAQRAQMAEMMKAQGDPFGNKERECLTAQEAARRTDVKTLMAEMSRDASGCRFEPVKAGGSMLRFKGRCEDPDGFTGDVNGELQIDSAKAVRFRYEGKGRMPAAAQMPGMPPMAGADGLVTMQIQGQSRWVAAACGEVKPAPR